MSDKARRLAEAVGRGMMERDHAAIALGIALEEIRPGYAKCGMDVRQDMLNGHDMCHGGMIFTLADTAFAYACNSFNAVSVAHTAQVTFCLAAKKGDRLSAIAEMRQQGGRTGVYDVQVLDQEERIVALFRGVSYRLQGEVVPDPG